MEISPPIKAASYNAVQIANEFIERGVKDGIKDMTNMKIQKLVYFAQGFYLAIYDRPLIQEDFEVWKHGPVVRRLYEKFKEVEAKQGLDPKHSYDAFLSVPNNHIARVKDDDVDAISVINSVWSSCKEYKAGYLRRLTHIFDSPWAITLYRKGPKTQIPNSEIAAYFKNLMKVK